MSSVEYINSVVLTASAANVTFSNIPQYYQDLIININSKSVSGSGNRLQIRFNSDSNTNYSATVLAGDGSSAFSVRNSSQTYGTVGYTSSANYSVNIINISSYKDINIFKTLVSESSDQLSYASSVVSLWRSSSAITSTSLDINANNFDIGTTATLWGVR